MKHFTLLAALFFAFTLSSCGDDDSGDGGGNGGGGKSGEACYYPHDTLIMIGAPIIYKSCSKDYKSLRWLVDGEQKGTDDSLVLAANGKGQFQVTLEVTSEDGSKDSFSSTLSTGFGQIKEFRILALNDGGYNELFPKYTLTINADNTDKKWFKSMSDNYEDITSLPDVFNVNNPGKYKLGSEKWVVKGNLSWEGSTANITGTAEFHPAQSFTWAGTYQFTIPNVALIEIVPEVIVE